MLFFWLFSSFIGLASLLLSSTPFNAHGRICVVLVFFTCHPHFSGRPFHFSLDREFRYGLYSAISLCFFCYWYYTRCMQFCWSIFSNSFHYNKIVLVVISLFFTCHKYSLIAIRFVRFFVALWMSTFRFVFFFVDSMTEFDLNAIRIAYILLSIALSHDSNQCAVPLLPLIVCMYLRLCSWLCPCLWVCVCVQPRWFLYCYIVISVPPASNIRNEKNSIFLKSDIRAEMIGAHYALLFHNEKENFHKF